MRYITILDFERGEVHSFPLLGEENDDFIDIAEAIEVEYGLIFKERNCQWMITSGLPLQIH